MDCYIAIDRGCRFTDNLGRYIVIDRGCKLTDNLDWYILLTEGVSSLTTWTGT